jgi:hypothetical protein
VELTHRDWEVIAYLTSVREAGVDLLGRIFFATNPQRGTANKRPAHAALQRLCVLRDAGYVFVKQGRVRATALGATSVNGSPSDPIDGTRAAHHDATLAAIEDYRRTLPSGTVISDVRLEASERARRMKGRGVARRSIGLLPDAVLTLRDATGRHSTVALEFVGASYTKEMIRQKERGFRSAYDDVVYYADSIKTAHKVVRVIAEPCRCV